MTTTTLSRDAIIEHLDISLDVEFTFIHTEPLADMLIALDRAEQEFLLDWVRRVASTNTQLAHQFLAHASSRIHTIDNDIIESWALHAMDLYDQSGLHAAMNVIRDVDAFIEKAFQREAGAVFEEYAGILTHFAHGLSGRKLSIDEADAVYTDSATIFLPSMLAVLPTKQLNFGLLKVMVAFCWAQTRFGSFRLSVVERLLDAQDDTHFMQLYQNLESLRLEACIQRDQSMTKLQ